MYEQTKKDKVLFPAILALVALALGGSALAWLGSSSCGACGGAQELLKGSSLAPWGVGFYSALLLLGLLLGRTKIFFSGVLLAAAVHLVLLVALYQHRIACVPCIVVGSAVLLAAGLSLFAEADNLARGSVLLPVGALLAHATLFGAGLVRVPEAEATFQPAALAADAPSAPEMEAARLLVFTRADCRYCDELERDVLPELVREFGARLTINREPAPSSLLTPTLVVSGQSRTVFPGLPPTAQLRDAILRALGKGSHESSMLPKSR